MKGTFTNSQYTAITTAAELASYDTSKHLLMKHANFEDNTKLHLMLLFISNQFFLTLFDLISYYHIDHLVLLEFVVR